MNTEELLQLITEIADQFKAEDLTLLKMDQVCDFTDYFVIASGTSSRQLKSLADEIVLKSKHQGRPALDVEGLDAGEWCLLDFGEIIVHLFLPEKRAQFDLEELWKEAERIQLKREEV